jgi:hypothetical protein
MADKKPTFYYVQYMEENGATQASLYKAVYNLSLAVIEICNHLDVDNGTLGTDFLNDIGTPLAAAMAKLKTPHTACKTIAAS